MGGMLISRLLLLMETLGSLSQCFDSFVPFVSLRWGMAAVSDFGKIFGRVAPLFWRPLPFSLSSLHNAPIHHFCSVQSKSISSSFHFFRNLKDRNTQDLQSFLMLLENVNFYAIPGRRILMLTLLGGVFASRSFIS